MKGMTFCSSNVPARYHEFRAVVDLDNIGGGLAVAVPRVRGGLDSVDSLERSVSIHDVAVRESGSAHVWLLLRKWANSTRTGHGTAAHSFFIATAGGGFQEQFDEDWGWSYSASQHGSHGTHQWPLWGGQFTKNRAGLAFFLQIRDEPVRRTGRKVWIPLLFPCSPDGDLAAHLGGQMLQNASARHAQSLPGLRIRSGAVRRVARRCWAPDPQSALRHGGPGRRRFGAIVRLSIVLACGGAIGVFFGYRDSRPPSGGNLSPDQRVASAEAPGMSKWDVQALLDFPEFGDSPLADLEARVYFLPDGSTLVLPVRTFYLFRASLTGTERIR